MALPDSNGGRKKRKKVALRFFREMEEGKEKSGRTRHYSPHILIAGGVLKNRAGVTAEGERSMMVIASVFVRMFFLHH